PLRHLFEKALIERLGLFYVCRKWNELSKVVSQLVRLFIRELSGLSRRGHIAFKVDRKPR
ncbi:hypothetical protein, partial [Aliivibrio fischeri]|uniref:hypothetical protein n=1 Tax=Aliivibrio fischeri TaxID=668 RepID=UPI001BE495AD